MSGWRRRLRGLAGLSAVGGVVGAVIGFCWVLVAGLLGGGVLDLATLLWGAGLVGGLGALSAGALGGALAVLDDGKSVAELSSVKAGLLGAAGGVGVTFAVVTVLMAGAGFGGVVPFGFLLMGALLGGTFGVGAVAAAKRSARKELEAGASPDRRIGL